MSVFEQLNREAAKQELRFIVIGGHAVMQHGYQRGTEDADILVDKNDRVLWQRIAEGLGYKFHHDGGAFLQYDAPEAAAWDLDIMLVPAETFHRLWAEIQPSQLEGASVAVPSLQHLLALKIHALKHGHGLRVLKDMDDVANLVLANRVDVRSEWFRQLFEKHGNMKLYERIVRILAE
ncbi:MAG: nucleotidyltransferase family protein [Verrucomicrobiota bacterium]